MRVVSLGVVLLSLIACGPPDVESREDFIQRMEEGARAREQAVAQADQREVEASIRSAEEQESIHNATLAEFTGRAEPDPDAPELEPMDYEELVDVCGLRGDECVVQNLQPGPHNYQTLTWLADAYERLGRREEQARTLRIRHGLSRTGGEE